jgi:sugar lactone lactonase YvrE
MLLAIVMKLYSTNLKVDGKESKFLNDLEVLDDGRIVVTDCSANYQLRDVTNVVFENAPNGRLV